MTDQAVPTFRRGAEEAKEATKGGAPFARTKFFKLDDKPPDNQALVRFIHDAHQWIVVDQYQFLPTKPKPAGWEANWPPRMGAVSRSDVALKAMFDTDYIAEHMRTADGKKYRPSPRTWTLGCLREEVFENGQKVGYRDKTRDVVIRKDDGSEETITIKDIQVINLGYKNFFSFLEGFYRAYGTLMDRDYLITRSGTEKDTTYTIAPLDPIKNADGEVFDLRNPKFADRYATDWTLESVILEMASDEYVGRFFDPSYVDPLVTNKGNGDGAPASEQAKPDTDSDAEARMRAVADRLKGGGEAKPYDETPVEAAGETPAAPAAPVGSKNFD